MTCGDYNIPEGMTIVDALEFFEFVGGPWDVHPSHRHPDVTIWELKNRTEVARSWSGWKYPGKSKVYAIWKDKKHEYVS